MVITYIYDHIGWTGFEQNLLQTSYGSVLVQSSKENIHSTESFLLCYMEMQQNEHPYNGCM